MILRTASPLLPPLPEPSQPVGGGGVEGEGCRAWEPGVQGSGGRRMWAALGAGTLRSRQADCGAQVSEKCRCLGPRNRGFSPRRRSPNL